MLFIDRIFTYFSKDEKIRDTNKDTDGRGTLERYNRLMGDDLDVNIMPFIDNLVQNVLQPNTMQTQFIPISEADMGVDLLLIDTIQYRRAVLSVITRLYQIKGTLTGYYILFGMLGWTVTITEHFDEWGFDSSITFDDVIRRFDSGKCPSCSDYDLTIVTTSGVPPTVTEQAIIKSIIHFNEPINARLRKLTFNLVVLTGLADFNDDFNNDFLIE